MRVQPIVADVTDPAAVALIAACPDADVLLTNDAAPPPGPFLQWEEEDWAAALEATSPPH